VAVSFDAFDKELRLATQDLEPAAMQKALAAFAKQSLADVISSGQASANYNRYVNGQLGIAEELVDLPGPIVYEFSLWEPIITFAIDRLQKAAPRKSGRFAASFIVLADQQVVTDYDAISPGAEVIITNYQPYIRKVEGGQLGVARFSVFDGTKRALARQFGNDGRNTAAFRFETQWLTVSTGVHAGMPYILKRGEKLRAAKQNMKSSAFRLGNEFLSRRKSRQPGQPITYPAIIINQA
jgi:hypothetical protein